MSEITRSRSPASAKIVVFAVAGKRENGSVFLALAGLRDIMCWLSPASLIIVVFLRSPASAEADHRFLRSPARAKSCG